MNEGKNPQQLSQLNFVRANQPSPIPKGFCYLFHQDEDSSGCEFKHQCFKGCLLAKFNIKNEFRIISIRVEDYPLLGMKWTDDYYSDRFMPVGCPSSSKAFETFSTAVEFFADLLDDFFHYYTYSGHKLCSDQLNLFLDLCQYLDILRKWYQIMSPNLFQMHMSLCAKNGIKHALTPPYHPQSNGASERAVRKTEEALVKQVLEGSKERSIKTGKLLFRYRITPRSTTAAVPTELLMKHLPRTRLNQVKPDLTQTIEGKQNKQMKYKDLKGHQDRVFVGNDTSSETQGQLEGAGKKLGRRKVKNEEKSPWGQSFNGPVPKRRSSSGF